MTRVQTIFLRLLISSLLLVIGLYMSSPWILTGLLRYQLGQMGLDQSVITIQRPGLQGTDIDSLGFVYRKDDRQYTVSASKIRLMYNLSALFRGKLDRIDIAEARVVIDKQQPDGSTETASSSPPDWSVLYDMPVQYIDLRKAVVVNKLNDVEPVQITLSADTEFSPQHASAQLHVRSAQNQQVLVRFRAEQSGALQLRVFEPEQNATVVALHSTQTRMLDTGMESNLRWSVDLERLGGISRRWGVQLPVTQLQGSISGHGRFRIPLTGGQDFSQRLQASQIQAQTAISLGADSWTDSFRDIQAQVNVSVQLDKGRLIWGLDKDSQLSLLPTMANNKDSGILPLLLDSMAQQRLTLTVPQGLQLISAINGQLQETDQISVREQVLLLNYGDRRSKLRVDFSLADLSLERLATPVLQANMSVNVVADRPALLNARKFATTIRGKLSMALDRVQLVFDPGSSLQLDQLSFQGNKIRSMKVSLAKDAACDYRWHGNEWACGRFDVAVSLPEIEWSQYKLSIRTMQASIDSSQMTGSNWQLSANLEGNDLKMLWERTQIQLRSIKSRLTLNNDQVLIQAFLHDMSGLARLRLSARHGLDSGEGSMDFRLEPLQFSAENSVTDALFGKTGYPLQLQQGLLQFNGKVSWRNDQSAATNAAARMSLEQRAEISLQNISGKFNQTSFKDLSTSVQVLGKDRILFKKPATITLSRLDPGVVIADIHCKADFEYIPDRRNHLTITEFSANTLGGSIQGDNTVFDLQQPRNLFNVALQGLDLGQILALEKGQGVSGSGVIDAQLPISLGTSGLTVRNGLVQARPPGGKLRYQPTGRISALAKSNTNIGLLVQALSDFSFNELVAQANYVSDGSLDLSVRLKGSNPTFQNGRAVHLNVTVQENILQLIRSLQLGDEIGRGIGEKVLERNKKD